MSLRLKFLAVTATASLGLIVAATAFTALVSLRDAQWWVTHTYQVIDALRAQEASLLEAESAARGMLLAPAPEEQERYQRARAEALSDIGAMQALTRDNPRQEERLLRFRQATEARVAYLDHALESRSVARPAEGRALGAEVRRLAAEVEAEERDLLAARIQTTQARSLFTKVVLVVGSGLAFLLSLLFMRDLKRDVDAREATRKLVQEQARQLGEQTVVLEASKNAAESANRTKSMFLANMSHELRTPLNAVLGYSEMLQEEAEDRGLDGFIPDLKSIHAAGKHLLGLINDVLDLSKIEAGKMDIFLEDFPLATMLDDVERTIRPLIGEKANELVVTRGELGTMHGDLTKVRQTLFNVLSNAAKFTERGTIHLEAETKHENDRRWVVFRVTDSGIGMNAEQRGRLFEPFVQADASTTRKFGGTGLGLAISRRFCHMMGGDIQAASEPGQGSTFTITLPLEVVPPKSDSAAALPPLSEGPEDGAVQPLVLVVDDDHDTRDLMDRYLTKEGFRVVTARDGEEGMRLARELRPVAMTLDVMMPTTDGWSVLTRMKDDPELHEIPVIMLTMVSDRGLAYRLGASEFMTKPIDRARLAAVMARFRDPSGESTALVVEDDAETRRMTRAMLERDGFIVDEADNGAVALARISQKRPDVILLDLMMPTMDGFELAATLHASDAWKMIPIVVLTAKDLTDEDRRRLNGSVEKIIEKGAYERRKLLDDVRDIVARHAGRAASRTPEREPEPHDA